MVGSFSTLKSISYKQASLCTSSREERNCFSRENHTQAHRGNQTTVVLMTYTGVLTNGLMPAAYLLGSPAHEEMAGWQTTANPQAPHGAPGTDDLPSQNQATLWQLSVENCVGLADDWT